jgi:hypothetical protein
MNNNIYLFLSFICISLVNIISTTHFFPIMLIGVNFVIFSHLLHKEEYYKITFPILTFLVFEINFGIPYFSTALLSFVFLRLLLPYLKTTFTFSSSNYYIQNMLFYFLFTLCVSIFLGISFDTLTMIILNLLLDSLVIWMVL